MILCIQVIIHNFSGLDSSYLELIATRDMYNSLASSKERVYCLLTGYC